MSNTLRSELIKTATLPAAVITIAATAIGSVALAATFAAQPTVEPGLPWVPFAQVGFLLLGALCTASEYAGGQIRTSLVAVPRRLQLLRAKMVAYLVAAVSTAAGTAAAAAVAMPGEPAWFVGAVIYLVATGLLGFGAGMIARNVVGAFAGTLTVVLIVSPLLRGATELARYLPDQAGAALFGPGALGRLEGGVVVLVWVVVVLAVAGLGFRIRDA